MDLTDDLPTMSMPITRAGTGSVTIGVAIDIPHPWGAELQKWRAEFGDPLAWAIPPHVTLLPPTQVETATFGLVETHLERVATRAQPFRLRLSGTGTFRPVSSVVFVKVAHGAPSCDLLQQRVRTGPLVRELAFPFHPHVTVAHEVDSRSLDRALSALHDFEASFLVDSFGLFEHGSDGVWRPRRRFDFGGGGG
ncbi:MAG: 2'-5' RNA ligase family protein [Kineosporiaceae bacterium]